MIKLAKNQVPLERIALFTLCIVPVSCLVRACLHSCKHHHRQHHLFNMLRLYPCHLLLLVLMTVWASFSILLKHQVASYAYYFYVVCIVLSLVSSLLDAASGWVEARFFAHIADPLYAAHNHYSPLFDSLSSAGAYSFCF